MDIKIMILYYENINSICACQEASRNYVRRHTIMSVIMTKSNCKILYRYIDDYRGDLEKFDVS